MGGDPAELAFGHALAMLGDPDVAADVAAAALRRAGRSRRLVLAHARYQAVTQAGSVEPVDIANLQTRVLDLPALAATLASTRPPEERAALDVRARTSGDLAALGEALGMRPTEANDKCNEIAELWERNLDPALLAFGGPGDCEDLARILDSGDTDSVAGLLDLAPAIRAHVQDHTECADRLRAMTPVRTFFSAATAEVPPNVREVGRLSRRRRPAAEPPPLFLTNTGSHRRAASPRRLVVAGVVLIVAGVGVWVAARDPAPSNVGSLTKLAKTTALVLSPPNVNGGVATIEVRNTTNKPVTFKATASEPWVKINASPAMIGARSALPITINVTDAAPEGQIRATVTITTDDGVTAAEEVDWTIERAPDLDASAVGCAVSVNVVEEGDLSSLVLHWRDLAGEHAVDITSASDGYKAELAPDGQDLVYWVTAVDARGNQSRTADQVIAANAC
jgi:hypothetical protein